MFLKSNNDYRHDNRHKKVLMCDQKNKYLESDILKDLCIFQCQKVS